MPLFAYICKACGASAELLSRPDEKVRCPACESPKMERQLSRFAALSGRATPETACSGCAMANEGCCPSQSLCHGG